MSRAARRPATTFVRRTTGPRPSLPSTAGSPGTRSGCWSPPRPASLTPRFRDLPASPAGRGPAGGQHLRHAARGAGRPVAVRPAGGRAPGHRPRDGTWVAELRSRTGRRHTDAGRRPGERGPAARRGPGCDWWRPTRVRDSSPTGSGNRLWRVRIGGDRVRRAGTCTGTAGRSPTATCAAASRWPTTRRSSPPIPAAPRCPAPEDLSPASWSTRLVAAGVGDRADHPAHRGVLAGRRRGAAGRMVRRCRRRPPSWSPRPGGPAAG